MKPSQYMLPVVLLCVLFLFPVNGIAADRFIITDQTCTDLRQIPQWAIEQAKSTLHIAYGPPSHGRQLIPGMGSSKTELDVFMTADGAGATGNVNVHTNQIRNFCWANKKILYDFADIKGHDPDGQIIYATWYANDNNATKDSFKSKIK
jgi:hypothetical protein